MQGQRVELVSDNPHPLQPGEYAKVDGVLWAHVPEDGVSIAGEVVERDDGTVSAVFAKAGRIHQLDHGVWR